MAGTTLTGVLLTGNHASRPAANAVGTGTLYSCTTHSLIYQTDGSSWSTWATLTGTGLTDPMTTRGDMIVRDSSNTTARLAKGSAGKFLTSDGTDIAWGNGPMTTAGDLIIGGASGAPTRLAAGSTSGHVLTSNGAGAAPSWQAASGGSTVYAEELPIDAAARAAVGSGDLFGGTSLDGGWSSMQSTALTSNDRSVDGYLIQKNTGNTGGAHRGLKRTFSPAGDCSVYAKLMWSRLNASFKWAGISLGATDPSDGGSGNRIDFFAIYNSGPKFKFAKYAAGVETSVFDNNEGSIGEASRPTDSTAQHDFPLWLRIKRVGSTLTAGISRSGVDWIDQSTTTTISFTINTICLFVAGSSDTGDLRAEWAWIATTG